MKNTVIPTIVFGLFVSTIAAICPAAPLSQPQTAAATLPVRTLGTITVRPSPEDLAAATAAQPALPVLPTIHVTASEEEILAARIDPTDRIAVMAPIVVTASADDAGAATPPEPASATGRSQTGIGALLLSAPHRFRLDMPYYSFGK